MAENKSSLPPLNRILENIFEDAPEYFVVLDEDLNVSIAGSAFRQATGMSSGEPVSFLETVERFSLSRVREVFEELRQGRAKSRELEINHRRNGGETVQVGYSWVACLDEAGDCRAFVGIGREGFTGEGKTAAELEDLKSELEKANAKMERRAKEISRLREELERRSSHDEMTDLGSRQFILDRLAVEAQRAVRYGEPMTVILFDVDRLTTVNETYGRDQGDEVLRQVAQVVREQIRATDVAGRFTGEEFMVLCPHTDRANAQFLAERLRRRVAELVFEVDDDDSFGVTISVGMVTVDHETAGGVEAILEAAGQALDAAKYGGMNRVRTLEVS